MAIDISVILLVAEIVLLAPTLVLIILGRKEERGRQLLLKEITNTAKMVSRQEYFNNVQFGMQTAQKSIKGAVTGSVPRNAELNEIIKSIEDQIKRARKRGVSVQYLFLKSPDRLQIASRYHQAGAEIGFHPSLLVSDIRYVVFDNKYVLLGLPSSAGANEPTREGYLIPSEGMAEIFLQRFDSNWVEAMKYDDFVNDVLTEAKIHSPNVSVELLSAQLKVPPDEVKRILAVKAG
ncbi:MAG: TrmB family transcriptional regulator sugar-binding domain-containing protein [Nitrososphaerales archaeon]